MARAQWKGQLRLKLVSCGVELYSAISDWKRKTGLNLTNVDTGNRVRYQSVDSQTGEEVSTNVGRSYEIDKTSRVLIDPEGSPQDRNEKLDQAGELHSRRRPRQALHLKALLRLP